MLSGRAPGIDLSDEGRTQADALGERMATLSGTGDLVLLLGGDCSILLGALLGLRQARGEPLGLIYIDAHGSETPLVQHVDDRKEATDVARQAAAERGAGRMVLPGSTKLPNCVCVVPVVDEAA